MDTCESRIIFHPGTEHSLARRFWQGCPTLEPSPLNHSLRVQSDDDGVTWSEPIQVVNSNSRFTEADIRRGNLITEGACPSRLIRRAPAVPHDQKVFDEMRAIDLAARTETDHRNAQ